MSDFMEGWIGCMWTGVVLGSLGALSCDIWPIAWLMLEVNIMRFIPLISYKWNAKKATLMYFVVQRVGSLMMLTGVVGIILSCCLSGLLLKMALAPFHYWGAPFVNALAPFLALIFITWQKLAPLLILISSVPSSWLVLLIILNAYIGVMNGIWSKSFILLLFHSSFVHVSWIISCVSQSVKYFLIYAIMLAPLFLVCRNLMKGLLIFNLGGLPPFSGFFLKVVVLQRVPLSIGAYLLMTSSFLLYAYLRVFLLRLDGVLNASICTLFVGIVL